MRTVFSRKWKEVYERLPLERATCSLADISGFNRYCDDQEALRHFVFRRLAGLQRGSSPGRTVCAVGCGCGDKLKLFCEAGFQCFGVDYSSSMIERAKVEMPAAQLFNSEAIELPFPSACADIVFSFSVFIYFEAWDYAARALEEMWRVARPGAVVCVWDVPDVNRKKEVEAFRGPAEQGYEHTYYDMNDFVRWFLEHGASEVRSEYVVLPFYKHSLSRFHITAVKPSSEAKR